MSPASGPVNDPKQFPNATMDDQDAIAYGDAGEPTVLGPPPISSPDPRTDGIKMLPLEDGTSAHQARLAVVDDASTGGGTTDYESMDKSALKSLAEERDLSVESSGKTDQPTKADYVAALGADDASDMKAADFKERIEASTTVDELQEAADLYDNSGKDYKSVDAAIDAKNEQLTSGGNGNNDDGN